MTKLVKLLVLSLGVAVVTPNAFAERQVSLTERLDTMERIINARGQAQVNLSQDIDSLQNELSELRGISEEHNYKLSQILERQRELYQELDKLNESTKKMMALRDAQAAPSLPMLSPNANTSVSGLQVAPATQQASLDENQAYDKAVNLVLKDKRYEQAIPEFQAFINKYPESSYQPNAHYWLGQLLFTKGEFKSAAKNFLTVVDMHTESNKRPDSLFKLGLVAQKLSNMAEAKVRFEQVVSEYPDSTAAKLAKQRLLEL